MNIEQLTHVAKGVIREQIKMMSAEQLREAHRILSDVSTDLLIEMVFRRHIDPCCAPLFGRQL